MNVLTIDLDQSLDQSLRLGPLLRKEPSIKRERKNPKSLADAGLVLALARAKGKPLLKSRFRITRQILPRF